MKRISNYIIVMLFGGIFFGSCVKDRNVGPDFSSTDPVLELRTSISDIAGLAYFGRAVIGNLADTVQFYANLASAYTSDHDINVTIGVDLTLVNTYNTDSTNAVKYEPLPDSCYTLLKTAGTIVKGQRIDSFQIAFYKDKIDPTHNYMLPVKITDGSGVLISGNQGIIWFHAIGNPIAGSYNYEWIRWNAGDTTGTPDYDLDYSPGIFAPDNPTQVEVGSGYYNGPRYIITFDNNGGTLSNFQVSLNPADLTGWPDVGITLTSGPTIIFADPISGQYRFTYQVSSGGAPRTLIDYYYK